MSRTPVGPGRVLGGLGRGGHGVTGARWDPLGSDRRE